MIYIFTRNVLTLFTFLVILQRVKDEVQRRKMQSISCHERQDEDWMFLRQAGHEQFHTSLAAAKLIPTSTSPLQECQRDVPTSPKAVEQQGVLPQRTGQSKLLTNYVYGEPIQTIDSKP